MPSGRDLSALRCMRGRADESRPCGLYIGGRIARFPPSEMILMT